MWVMNRVASLTTGGSMLGKNFKAVAPDGDLGGFLIMFMIPLRAVNMFTRSVRLRAGTALTAAQHGPTEDRQYQNRDSHGEVNDCDGFLLGS